MANVSSEKHMSSTGVNIEVIPRVCLHDAPTSIKVTGLTPNSPVTLTLTTHNDAGKKFHSFAHYVSNAKGEVDMEESEAMGGAFTGIFPSGLFSSLAEYPFNFTRLQKKDCTTPWKMTLLVHEGHLTLEQSTASSGMASVQLERYIMGPGVRREPVIHDRVRGTVFLPAGPGPHPPIIDIFGGDGGLKEYKASMFASRGFACLAIAYFGYGDLPKTLTTMDLDYFEEAVEYILKQPGVIPDRCGVVSSSKGASLGLPMGIYLPKVTAVVSIGGNFLSNWTLTYRGREVLQAAKPSPADLYESDEQNIVTYNESAIKKILRHDHPSMPPCEIAPEDSHFLLIAGDKDNVFKNLDLDVMVQRMKLSGRERQCHSVVNPGAGHIIELPYNTHGGYSRYIVNGQKLINKWGGDPLATCKAQEDNWQNMRKFLEMHVRDRSPWYEQYVGMTSRKGTF